MDSLNGKVVIITGASEGNRRAFSRCAARCGAHLSLIARNESKLAAVAATGDLVIAGDLTDDIGAVRANREDGCALGKNRHSDQQCRARFLLHRFGRIRLKKPTPSSN